VQQRGVFGGVLLPCAAVASRAGDEQAGEGEVVVAAQEVAGARGVEVVELDGVVPGSGAPVDPRPRRSPRRVGLAGVDDHLVGPVGVVDGSPPSASRSRRSVGHVEFAGLGLERVDVADVVHAVGGCAVRSRATISTLGGGGYAPPSW
jgi:hypothetical protein